MSVSVEREAIRLSLQPLFDKAEADGLWFFHESSQVGQVWCSPEYLRLKQAEGEYVWAPEHWELRSPLGYMKSLHTRAEAIVKEHNELAERLGRGPRLTLGEVSG